MIPDEAVEAAAKVLAPVPTVWEGLPDEFRAEYRDIARAVLESAAPFIAAQALREAVDAFPLETITAPDSAVMWMRRRAGELRRG